MSRDFLVDMVEKQRVLQQTLGYDFENMTDEERVEYIKEYVLHTEHELHEMLKELPFFKKWKKYSEDPIDRLYAWGAARKEFSDVMHFMLNIALALDLEADIMHGMYTSKNMVNHRRQEDKDNYKPCKEDGR